MVGRRVFVILGGILLLLLMAWTIVVAASRAGLPEGYHLIESEDFWGAELLQSTECRQEEVAGVPVQVCNEQLIPPTLVDYAVRGDYLLVMRADRDMHFSEGQCAYCMQQAMPCVDYWVINTKSRMLLGPLSKQDFDHFLSQKSIRPVELNHKVPSFLKKACFDKR